MNVLMSDEIVSTHYTNDISDISPVYHQIIPKKSKQQSIENNYISLGHVY